MALEHLEQKSTCRCGQPIEEAWHSDMDGWYERQGFVCHACTALAPDPEKGQKEPVVHYRVINTRPVGKPLAPFELGTTTTAA